MSSRLPNEDEDEARAAAAAFQSALAQQVRPLLGGWDPVTALATMHRNMLQQQQQAAAAAAGLTSQASIPNIPALWPYGLPGGVPPQNSATAAATAAASLA